MGSQVQEDEPVVDDENVVDEDGLISSGDPKKFKVGGNQGKRTDNEIIFIDEEKNVASDAENSDQSDSDNEIEESNMLYITDAKTKRTDYCPFCGVGCDGYRMQFFNHLQLNHPGRLLHNIYLVTKKELLFVRINFNIFFDFIFICVGAVQMEVTLDIIIIIIIELMQNIANILKKIIEHL